MSLHVVSAAERRRSANYKPSIWTHQYLQSRKTAYGEERFLHRAEKLKGEVIALLEKTQTDTLDDQIEVVDILQRLGIAYHFTDYTEKILGNIISSWSLADDADGLDHNLHATALSFRLLRQHGDNISTDVFKNFMDEAGNFKTTFCNDIKGLLSLYEASYLSLEGETILDEAKEFSTHHLNEYLKKNDILNENIAEEVAHALEVPFHHAMRRLETRWFIDAYAKRSDINPIIFELAKLDFNMVQAMYQNELKELSKWNTETRLAEKMSFARDRLVESFLWTVGFTFEPRFAYCRIMCAKMTVLITIIDDIYDVYGTLDELQMFTDAVQRWDINAMEQLPEYMKICFLALFNTINESAYDVLRDHGFNIIPHSTRMWIELCKTYMLEAQWYHTGYKPSMNEYLANGCVSIAGPLILVHSYLYMTNPLEVKPLEDFKTHTEILKWPSLICRLADDMGTSSDELKRGDTPKSIQCYMHDTGCSEEDSRDYIKNLMGIAWKKINKEALMNNAQHPRDFINSLNNYVRIAQCMYQYGDGHGIPDCESKARILSLVMEPIPLP